MTVFVPISVAAAQHLRSAGRAVDLVGYADGAALRQALGDARLDDEEADYVALNHAGVAALLLPGADRRLVLAADLDLAGADELGTVDVPALGWADVASLFADEDGAAGAVATARAAVAGRALVDALAAPEVAALQDGFDLLWFAPEELDALA